MMDGQCYTNVRTKITHVRYGCVCQSRIMIGCINSLLHCVMSIHQLFVALCDEYTHRYGKVHLTDQKLRHILANCPIMTDTPFIAPPKVMPDEYQSDDTLSAYRNYYRYAKADILAYTNCPIPNWLAVSDS